MTTANDPDTDLPPFASDPLALVARADVYGVSLERRNARWRLRYWIDTDGRRQRRSRPLPDDPALHDRIRDQLRRRREARQARRQAYRNAKDEQTRQAMEERETLRRLKRAYLRKCGGGSCHQRRMSRAFDLAVRKDEVMTFLNMQPWRMPVRPRGRPRTATPIL